MSETFTAPSEQTSDSNLKGYEGFDSPEPPAAEPYEGFDWGEDKPQPTFEDLGAPKSLTEVLEANEVKTSRLRKFAGKVLGKSVKVQSSVGDVKHSLHDYAKLSDYKSGLENLTDGGFDKTGKFDESRETILSSLHDEALTQNELVDHANPMAEASKRVLEADSPEKAAQIGREAVAGLKDTEMSKLIQTIEANGTDADKQFIKSNLTEQSYKYLSVDDIRTKREEVLNRTLADKKGQTLRSVQDAAIRQRN